MTPSRSPTRSKRSIRAHRLHARRVQRYATELTGAVEQSLLDDPSLEYGFLLHDIGKIGVPDAILNKPGPLDEAELQRMHNTR
jgi:HD-GYP domain-containing protein (c-di-GMP phosphodiesterase class II)